MRDDMTRGVFLERADVRSKALAFAVVMVLVFLRQDPLWQLLLAAGSALMLGTLGLDRAALRRTFGQLPIVLIFVFVFAAFVPPPGRDATVLFRLPPSGWVEVTLGGLEYALTLVLRIVTMVCATVAFTRSTPSERWVTWLHRIRAPQSLIFVLQAGARFIPSLQNESQHIIDARRVRGVPMKTRGLIAPIRTYATVMVPMIASSVRVADELAAAMQSRGYGARRRPTLLYDLTWGWRDWVIVAAALTLLALGLWPQ